MKNFFDAVVKWAPAIIGMYILFAMLRALFYYAPFNIPIYSYVDLDEIFTVWFFPTIVYFTFFCVPLIFLVFVFQVKPEDEDYLYYHLVPYILHALSCTFILYMLFSRNDASTTFARNSGLLGYSSLLSVFAVGFFISGLYHIISNYKKIRVGKVLIRKTNGVVLIVILSVNIFIFSIFLQLSTYIGMVPSVTYEIEFKDNEEIVTDDKVRYLGKTKNYFFLFDKSTGKAIIYKTEDILNIKIESELSKKMFLAQ